MKHGKLLESAAKAENAEGGFMALYNEKGKLVGYIRGPIKAQGNQDAEVEVLTQKQYEKAIEKAEE